MDITGPQCQVCLRTPENKLLFFCPTCARNALYELRLKHAQVLLSKEALAKEIESIALAQNSDGGKISLKEPSSEATLRPGNRVVLEETRSAVARSKTRTTALLDECTVLRSQVEKSREHIVRRKADIASRRSGYNAASELFEDKDKAVRPLQQEISTTEASWNRLHTRTAEARVFLCREAAALYGLQQRKKRKGIPGRDLYIIGGVPIVDLRDLNGADPEQVTTSITRVAHLLHLTSHYLGLKLPAEITLATASQPYSLIHTPLSSYKSAILPTGSRFHSSTAHSVPRQRLLSLDRPLHQLASEEPINYSLFIDAITLLAWDVAWVAKTQGFDIGAKNWEEICALGKNMWSLLVAPPRLPALRTRGSATDLSKGLTASSKQSPSGPNQGSRPSNVESTPYALPGQYSHSSSHSFLPSSSPDGGAEHLRGWRFANPVRIIERIKSALLNERTGAEWEVLEIPESDAAEEENVEMSSIPSKEQAMVSLETVEEDQISEVSSERAKPRKGWTKLRSPSVET